ncbi:tannase/feruloyl esterase family alpha/beta hydrolase [Sphingomonas turrisvirgatae]|uniref:Feruloyl esterase n=1 Tax=Sphingomonas turrisvirgatae TaxID=1888892 RepID=A0A1E3LVS3_9SPHN|nr:tannase/feruloyl esterase family alpha/beta hydrolase [Sphingomonas turrisvirgatae]ODP37862.1 feruloyl esterase [Sphingomonas turrisvirgatae]
MTAARIECTALSGIDFSHDSEAPASITSAKLLPATATTDEVCAVTGYVQPQVQFEVRLPTKRWNGRYFQIGCGGFCGFVNINGCGDMLAKDYVVAANNLGHVGDVLKEPLWGSSLDARRDYGARGTHVTALIAKRLIAAFYGTKPAFSYFRGCSTGGREGLMLAQHFPEDFDGIVAGDPAFAGRLGAIANVWAAQKLFRRGNVPVFDKAALDLLHARTIAACDAIDGVKDGIIDDPRRCRFDPAVLQCPASGGAACLTAEQVAAARAVYDGPRNSAGMRLYPGGMMPGSEGAWGGADTWSLPEGSLRYLMFADQRPNFAYHDFDWDRDLDAVKAQVALYDPVAPDAAPDLTAFHARGGRLILYHGWSDQGVTPLGSLDYYSQVAARQGGMAKIREWFRLFMVPGMFHCRGGNAPNSFDFMPAIAAWVEQGTAPDGIVATQREGERVIRTRPLYAYPATAKYDGKGDVNVSASWRLAMPKAMPDDRIDWIWGPKR